MRMRMCMWHIPLTKKKKELLLLSLLDVHEKRQKPYRTSISFIAPPCANANENNRSIRQVDPTTKTISENSKLFYSRDPELTEARNEATQYVCSKDSDPIDAMSLPVLAW